MEWKVHHNLNGLKKKTINTNLERYGVEHYSKTEERKKKISERWENYSEEELKQITDKREKTCLERYGVEHALQYPEFREKSIANIIGQWRSSYIKSTN